MKLSKKSLLFIVAMIMSVSSYADTSVGIKGMSEATVGVSSYLPYVRGICYVIAAIIAIVGAMSAYSSMLLNPQNTTKRITMTVGSCVAFIVMATALPQFFGYESNGSLSSHNSTTGGGGGSVSGDYSDFEGGTLLTEIPDLDDPRWHQMNPGDMMKW